MLAGDGLESELARGLASPIIPTELEPQINDGSGHFAALAPGAQLGDGQTTIGYICRTGEIFVDAPAGVGLTLIEIKSASGILTGNLVDSPEFDAELVDATTFRATTLGDGFASHSFGNIAELSLSEDVLSADLSVAGLLANTADLGNVDLIYVCTDSLFLSPISDQTVEEDTVIGPIAFTVDDPETPSDRLSVSVTSSDQTLIPNDNIDLEGSGAFRTVMISPTENRSGTSTITITAETANDKTSVEFDIRVDPVADRPEFTVRDARGNEDTEIALDITSSLVDTDGSESLSITVDGVPSGARLSQGEDQGNGTWILERLQLDRLTVTPAEHNADDFTLTVTAIATEVSGNRSDVSSPMRVEVDAIADKPNLDVRDTISDSFDMEIPLNVHSNLVDTDGSEFLSPILILGVPIGDVLSAGSVDENGTWRLEPDDLGDLTLSPTMMQKSELKLLVAVGTKELSNGSEAVAVGAVTVRMAVPGQRTVISEEIANPNEVDVFRLDFDIDAVVTVNVNATNTDTNAPILQPVLRAFDRDDTEIAFDNQSPGTNLTLSVRPGTYYIGVSSKGNESYDPASVKNLSRGTTSGEYELQLFRRRPASMEIEANNEPNSATLVSANGEITGSIDEAIDVDYFEFVLNESGTLNLDLQSDRGGATELRLLLIDERSVTDDLDNPRTAVVGSAVSITEILPSGSHFLRIAASNPVGPYRVTSSFTPIGNRLVTAKTLTVPRGEELVISASIDSRNDVDLFELHLDLPASLLIETSTQRLGSSLDTVLRVFNANGRDVDAGTNDDNVLKGTDESAVAISAAADTYYVGVSAAKNLFYDPTSGRSLPLEGFAGTSTGLYDLKIAIREFSEPPEFSEREPNDDRSNATSVPMTLGKRIVVSGSISEDDVDLYTIDIERPSWLRVGTVAERLGSPVDTSLRLDTFGGTVTGFPNSRRFRSGLDEISDTLIKPDELSDLLIDRLLAPGTYYIAVTRAPRVPGLELPNGFYHLNVHIPFSEFEPNGRPSIARDIKVGDGQDTTVLGVIGDRADRDLFRFRLERPTTVAVKAVGLQSSGFIASGASIGLEPVIRLFDVAGKPIGMSISSESPESSSFLSRLDRGEYLIGVSSIGNERYDVTVEESQQPGLGITTGFYQMSVLTGTPGLEAPVASRPVAIVAGQFNDDNGDRNFDESDLLDVAVAHADSGEVWVMLRKRNDTFSEPVVIDVGQPAASMVVEDLNGDSISDLIIAHSGSTAPTGTNSTVGTTTSGGVTLLFGNGDGTFEEPVFTEVTGGPNALVIIGDVNNDKFLDIATTNSMTNDVSVLFTNRMLESLESQRISVGRPQRAIVSADFNGDGLKDLATANSGSNSISILSAVRLDGEIMYEQIQSDIAVGEEPVLLVAADIVPRGGDELIDLVAVNNKSQNLSIVPGGENGIFGTTIAVPLGFSPVSIVAADFVEDHPSTDLAIASADEIIVLANSQSGQLQRRTAVGFDPKQIQASQFNKDDDTHWDLLATDVEGNRVVVLKGTGFGTFVEFFLPISFPPVASTRPERMTESVFGLQATGGIAPAENDARIEPSSDVSGDVASSETGIASIVDVPIPEILVVNPPAIEASVEAGFLELPSIDLIDVEEPEAPPKISKPEHLSRETPQADFQIVAQDDESRPQLGKLFGAIPWLIGLLLGGRLWWRTRDWHKRFWFVLACLLAPDLTSSPVCHALEVATDAAFAARVERMIEHGLLRRASAGVQARLKGLSTDAPVSFGFHFLTKLSAEIQFESQSYAEAQAAIRSCIVYLDQNEEQLAEYRPVVFSLWSKICRQQARHGRADVRLLTEVDAALRREIEIQNQETAKPHTPLAMLDLIIEWAILRHEMGGDTQTVKQLIETQLTKLDEAFESRAITFATYADGVRRVALFEQQVGRHRDAIQRLEQLLQLYRDQTDSELQVNAGIRADIWLDVAETHRSLTQRAEEQDALLKAKSLLLLSVSSGRSSRAADVLRLADIHRRLAEATDRNEQRAEVLAHLNTSRDLFRDVRTRLHDVPESLAVSSEEVISLQVTAQRGLQSVLQRLFELNDDQADASAKLDELIAETEELHRQLQTVLLEVDPELYQVKLLLSSLLLQRRSSDDLKRLTLLLGDAQQFFAGTSRFHVQALELQADLNRVQNRFSQAQVKLDKALNELDELRGLKRVDSEIQEHEVRLNLLIKLAQILERQGDDGRLQQVLSDAEPLAARNRQALRSVASLHMSTFRFNAAEGMYELLSQMPGSPSEQLVDYLGLLDAQLGLANSEIGASGASEIASDADCSEVVEEIFARVDQTWQQADALVQSIDRRGLDDELQRLQHQRAIFFFLRAQCRSSGQDRVEARRIWVALKGSQPAGSTELARTNHYLSRLRFLDWKAALQSWQAESRKPLKGYSQEYSARLAEFKRIHERWRKMDKTTKEAQELQRRLWILRNGRESIIGESSGETESSLMNMYELQRASTEELRGRAKRVMDSLLVEAEKYAQEAVPQSASTGQADQQLRYLALSNRAMTRIALFEWREEYKEPEPDKTDLYRQAIQDLDCAISVSKRIRARMSRQSQVALELVRNIKDKRLSVWKRRSGQPPDSPAWGVIETELAGLLNRGQVKKSQQTSAAD